MLASSLRHGLGNPPVRWMMLSSPFVFGVLAYSGYAAQPFLLQLYSDERAYSIAGLSAAVFAGAQIADGMAAPRIRRLFRRRTSTVLSFDNLLGSGGGVVIQPALGRVADAWSYSASYLAGAAVHLLAVPLVVLARRERAGSDSLHEPGATHAAEAAPAAEPAQAMASRDLA